MTLQHIHERLEAIERSQADLFMVSCLTKEYLTLKEAAAYLGVKIDKVYELTAAHAFPTFKPGGKITYVKRSDLNNWIEAARIESAENIDRKTNSMLLKKHKAA